MQWVTNKVPVGIARAITKLLGTSEWDLLMEATAGDLLAHNRENPNALLMIETYVLMLGEKTIASFELHPMIGCCAICVSTAAKVAKKYQGKGLGTILNKLRIHLAREQRYGTLLCTNVATNIPQRKILKKNGWKDIFTFLNPRTGNKIFISVVKL